MRGWLILLACIVAFFIIVFCGAAAFLLIGKLLTKLFPAG